MEGIKIFNSPMFGELRVTRNEKGELLFCLKDVCDSLELVVNNVVKRISRDPYNIWGLKRGCKSWCANR